jgi:hypothetical protein
MTAITPIYDVLLPHLIGNIATIVIGYVPKYCCGRIHGRSLCYRCPIALRPPELGSLSPMLVHPTPQGFASLLYADIPEHAHLNALAVKLGVRHRHGSPPSVSAGGLLTWCTIDHVDITAAVSSFPSSLRLANRSEQGYRFVAFK